MFVVRPKWLRMVMEEPVSGGGEPVEPVETAAEDQATDTEGEAEETGDEWDRERALAKVRKSNQEAKALRERAKAAEEKAAGAEEATTRATEAEARAMKLEVGMDLGLPKALALRLQGGSPEELTADAEELLKLLAPARAGDRPKPALVGGSPAPGDDMGAGMDAKSIVSQALGR